MFLLLLIIMKYKHIIALLFLAVISIFNILYFLSLDQLITWWSIIALIIIFWLMKVISKDIVENPNHNP